MPGAVVARGSGRVEHMLSKELVEQAPIKICRRRHVVLSKPKEHDWSRHTFSVRPVRVGPPFVSGQAFLDFCSDEVTRSNRRGPDLHCPVASS